MSALITDEMVEAAAEAMADDWNPERDPVLSAMFRDYAVSALEAVIPQIAAAVWDEGFEAGATWEQSSSSGTPHDPPLNPYD